MALALLFFKIERFANVMPTRWESSVKPIFRRAIITSKLTTIGMLLSPFLDGHIIFLFVQNGLLEEGR